jgi:hypothetical protein
VEEKPRATPQALQTEPTVEETRKEDLWEALAVSELVVSVSVRAVDFVGSTAATTEI